VKLKKILKTTRKWAEKQADEFPLDYGEDLSGLCAVASKKLYKKLKANGFNCELAYNDRHCFVLHNKHRVIDITASQFGLGRINVFTLHDNIEDGHHWVIKKTFTDVDELSDYQIERGWYDEQI